MAQELIDKIREQAQARGLDPDIAVQIARAESSLDPSAKAKTSSAQGLFQVIDKTWKEHGGKPGKKTDVDENIRVGLNVLQANQKALRETLGRDPSASELYAAHFLGATGAKGVLLASDDTPVSQLLSERAIKANPGLLKDKNVGQLRAALEAKMVMPGSRPTEQAGAPAVAPMPAAAAGAPKRPTIPSSKIAANQLGTGYQAALALSFLADEEDETPLTREQWQERQDQTTAADMLAGYKSKNALAEINWDESALFPAQPVKMAEGGEVEAVASDEQKFHQGQPLPQTDTLVGRAPYRSAQEQLALLEAMNPGVVINERPLAPGLYGYVRGSAPDVLNISTQQSPAQAEQTRLHEMEHSLDFRGGDILGRPGVGRTDQAYRAYYLLNKDWSPIRQFTENVANSREKLEQFFGMPMTSGYLRMSPEERKIAKDKGGRDALLPYFDEQLASLSALEQVTGKSITRDPEMRKLFPNTKMMAVYDALTGLRQTRLDARDLPPHTPLPSYTYETNPVVRFIREKTTGPKEYGIPIKRADGGDVAQEDVPRGIARVRLEQLKEKEQKSPLATLERVARIPVTPMGMGVTTAYKLANLVVDTTPLENRIRESVGLPPKESPRNRKERPAGYPVKLPPLEPIERADGGDVDLEKLQSEARQGEAYRQMEQYLKARDAMPNIVVKELPEPINAQFTAMRMPAGSGRIEVHKDPDVLRVIGPSVMAHELAHAAERQMGQQASEESSVFGGKSQFAEAYDKLVGRGPFVSGKKRAEFARKIAPDWAAFNREYRASPVEIGAHGVGAFAPSKNMQDSAPLHVDATAATEFQILLDLAQRNAKNRATGAVRIPNFLKQVLGFADGGEVEPTPEELKAASRPAFVTPKSGIGRRNTTKPGEIEAAVLQGVSEMPYNLVGSVADVGALALRPFGYTNPTPFLGSEHLKQLATRAGIRQAPPEQPTARAFYELSQLGSSLINPAAPVRAAAAAGQKAGRTAQQAMQDFQAYNRQLAAPGASYAVKPKGGEFTMEPGGGRDAPRIDSVAYYLKNEIGTRGDNALDQWVTDKLGRYMRRDMASPDDQFVKAAEQGRPLHFMPDRQPVVSTGTEPDFLKYVRQSEGFNPKGEATTPYGRAVETQVDLAVEPVRLEDFVGSERRLRPQTAAEIATNPERRVYEVMAPEVNDRLQFPELVTAIQNIRENNVFRAYGQSIPVPKELQFSDEALKGLSPAQASERVAAYNKWIEGARQKAASEAITKNPRMEMVKAEGDSTWVRVPDTAENPEILDLVKDVGCAGNWCTEQTNYAIQYGSGENRLHILMDKKAQPRVQMTLKERQLNPDEFLNSMDDVEFDAFKARYPDAVRYGDIANTPDYQEWLRLNPPGYRITEIKGFNNDPDLTRSPHLAAVQNYIKQLDKEGNLQGVSNLKGINMMDRDGLDIYNALVERYAALPQGAHKPFLEQVEARASNNSYKGTFTTLLEQTRALIDQKNGGSRYIVREDGPRLLKEALDEVFSPLEKANGGMVERRTDDSRKYL